MRHRPRDDVRHTYHPAYVPVPGPPAVARYVGVQQAVDQLSPAGLRPFNLSSYGGRSVSVGSKLTEEVACDAWERWRTLAHRAEAA
jgi:hypothetical protein